MEAFIRLTESVIEFEADISSTPTAEQNKHGLAIQQEELKTMWEKTKAAYDMLISQEGLPKEDIRAIRKKHKNSFASYVKGAILGTARVNIHFNGTDFSARALIDSGSECSFITERLKRRINLPSKRLHAQVSGITNSISAQVKEACKIELRSPIDPLFRLGTTVLVLAQLTGNLPTTHISAKTKQAFPDLVLADKRFFVNEQGGDIYPEIILSGLKKNVLNTLLVQETVFGWILTGRTDAPNPLNNIVSYHSEVTLDKQLTAFWEPEDIPKSKTMNEDDTYSSRSLRSEMKAFIAEARDKTVSKYGHQTLTWHFIPPAAPHMGGLWEAGVKSFKNHFKKIASTHKYTFEDLSTFLCRVESCLNSRPLSPSSSEPTDLEPLTPGHFLIGGHLLAPPELDVNENPASIVNRWQKLKALHQTFCRRWKSEHLSELQKRIKWKHPKENIKPGDLVVIKEDNLAPTEWRLGRVVNVHPGADSRVRVVDILTEKGQVTRPLVKLVLLPPCSDGNSEPTTTS
ncbi:uncharacterized protein LOC118736204 [Rhagoletis pomonella]|uniref:uncharacterized protein LOC118736204 n=1 Tax=Rhagoletis pomonella TaxID=28610 RepID=UPI0017846BB7|nr:uncharacterized protein LOC118736204 [Rhagoletis pomonella]